MTNTDMHLPQMRAIALTDEEAIALGSRAGIPWPSPVPSVDVHDPDGVRMSASRGARSLLARGLLDRESNLSDALEELLSPILHGELSVGTYMVDSAFAFAPDGPLIAGYSNGTERWIAEIVSPGGIHYLQEEPASGCLEAARRSLERAFADGPESLNKTGAPVQWTYMCVQRQVGMDRRVVAVRKGELGVLKLGSTGGSGPTPNLQPLESLTQACGLLDLR